jgi:dephospho-CoA kinase
MMNIFLISGYAGVGKSSVAKLLKSLRPCCEQTSFAKHVKDFVALHYAIERHMFDTQEGKKTVVESTHGIFTVRDLMIIHAESAKRKRGEGVWTEAVVAEIKSRPDVQNWILDDWRFPIEYTVLREQFWEAKIHRIRVINTNIGPYNAAEKRMDDEHMQCIIDNTLHNCMDAIVQLNSEIKQSEP